MRRAQASTEYLVVAAIVLIIALVAVALLGGNYGTDASKTSSIAAWRSARPISLIDYSKDGSVLTLVLFNNDAVALSVTAIIVDGERIELAKQVKIEPGSASKIYVPLPPSVQPCGDGTIEFSHRLTFIFESDGIERSEDGPATLVGQCASNEIPEEACDTCAESGEICCTPAMCDPLSHICTLSIYGNGIVEEDEDCANCGGESGDVHCPQGTTCDGETGQCAACIASGSSGCSETVLCCDEGVTCNEGYCGTIDPCGNGICDAGETCTTCPADCGIADGWCWRGEDEITCPDDCSDANCEVSPFICDPEESCTSCPEDCSECPECMSQLGNFCPIGVTCCNGLFCDQRLDSQTIDTCQPCVPEMQPCDQQGFAGNSQCCGYGGQEYQSPVGCWATVMGGSGDPDYLCCIEDISRGLGLGCQHGSSCCPLTVDDEALAISCYDNHCCIPNGSPSGGNQIRCCSGEIVAGIGDDVNNCRALVHPESCTFNAQCSSGTCTNGACTV